MVLCNLSARVCTEEEYRELLLEDPKSSQEAEDCLIALDRNGPNAFCHQVCADVLKSAMIIPTCHTQNGRPVLANQVRQSLVMIKNQCESTGTITITKQSVISTLSSILN